MQGPIAISTLQLELEVTLTESSKDKSLRFKTILQILIGCRNSVYRRFRIQNKNIKFRIVMTVLL